MNDEDVAIIIGQDWSPGQLRVLDGNGTESCASCRDPIVISREGRAFYATWPPGRARYTCLACARRDHPDLVPDAVPGAIERAQAAGVPLSQAGRLAGSGLPLREYGERS